MTHPPDPAIAVIIATYNRSAALACAIESVRRQLFTDWELIVVGDACTDDTAQVVARFTEADSRIRFVNLERNWGEQTGPNNVGAAMSRAPVIAYLSHDDVWLPNHLKACHEALHAAPADVVLGTAANIMFAGPAIGYDALQVQLQAMGIDYRWSPSEMEASTAAASCWMVRRDVLAAIGWRTGERSRAVPSQDLLFRWWRSGYRIHALNALTLVIVTAGTRPNSYLQPDAPEQRWIVDQLDNPAFSAELAARAYNTNPSAGKRAPVRPRRASRMIAAALAHVGINPNEVAFGLRFGARGAYMRHLRRLYGLPAANESEPDPASAVRADAVRRSCRVELPADIDFRVGAGGARFLAHGWSFPEAGGVWSDGPVAELMFDIGRLSATGLVFDFSLVAFGAGDGMVRHVEVLDARDASIEHWALAQGPCEKRLVVPAAVATAGRVVIRFRCENPESPHALGVSADRRELAMRLLRLHIDVSA